jgi:hypothetical protein
MLSPLYHPTFIHLSCSFTKKKLSGAEAGAGAGAKFLPGHTVTLAAL